MLGNGTKNLARKSGGTGSFVDPETERQFRLSQAREGHRTVAVILIALATLGAATGFLDYLRLDTAAFTQALFLRAIYVAALIAGAWVAWHRSDSYQILLQISAVLASVVTTALLMQYDPNQVSVMGAALLYVFATLVFLNVVSSSAATRWLISSINLIAAGMVPWFVQGEEPEGRVWLAIALAWTSIALLWFAARREEHLKRQQFASTAALRYQATHDPLTGLPNRRGFFEALDRLISRHAEDSSNDAGAQRLDRTSPDLTVVVLELDHFKGVNDRYGHDAGDLVLRALAQTLVDTGAKQNLGESATQSTGRSVNGNYPRQTGAAVQKSSSNTTLAQHQQPSWPRLHAFRMGGEEFTLILETDRRQPNQPITILNTLIEAIRELKVQAPTGQEINLRASCGAVRIDPTRNPIDEKTLAKALQGADRLLYRAKHRGRDRFFFEDYEQASKASDHSDNLGIEYIETKR